MSETALGGSVVTAE